MTAGADLVGKVFISHSWKDKPFVRRLAQRLRGEGFETWLDEHELRPGDRVAETIASVLAQCKVVLVVVSRASARSKWLAYEVSLATERMIAGRCRVIPLVIGRGEPPAAVRDILYADFRKSFRAGLSAVVSSLKHDAEQLALATTKRGARRRKHEPTAREQVFGAGGWASRLSDEGDRRKNWDVVYLPVQDPDGMACTVMVDHVRADIYDLIEPKSLRDGWWIDYVYETEYIGEPLRLVIAERPLQMAGLEPGAKHNRVRYRRFESPFVGRSDVHVIFADVSAVRDAKEEAAVYRAARRKLTETAQSLRVAS